MITPLLSLALALAAAAPAGEPAAVLVVSAPLSPERAQAIGRLAPDWNAYRSRAQRMMDGYAAAAARDGWDWASMDRFIAQVRLLSSNVEKVQYKTAELAREAVLASEPPSAARARRVDAVTSVFEGRMLTLYANLVPRVLNEGTKDANGRYDGRRYAGPEWSAPAFTFEEGGSYSAWQVLRAGFTRDEYQEFENRASDTLGLPRPNP